MFVTSYLHYISTYSPKDLWLVELHSKLWNRKDLKPSLFRQVEVNVGHYHALVRSLEKEYPSRDSDDYNADDVLSVKLKVLNNPVNTEATGDDLTESEITEIYSHFPWTLRFLDLSPLNLVNPPPRLPMPLLVREEYDNISQIIDSRQLTSAGSVLVSGQPGTGEICLLLSC
jgi:hypothetical protein